MKMSSCCCAGQRDRRVLEGNRVRHRHFAILNENVQVTARSHNLNRGSRRRRRLMLRDHRTPNQGAQNSRPVPRKISLTVQYCTKHAPAPEHPSGIHNVLQRKMHSGSAGRDMASANLDLEGKTSYLRSKTSSTACTLFRCPLSTGNQS